MPGSATEIKVLASRTMQPLLADIAPDFERSSGHTLSATYDSVFGVKNRIAAGEEADVVLTLRPALEALASQGKVKNISTVGRSFIAVVVPSGASKPDISSPDAFKRALLAAKTVVYSDPAKGGRSSALMVQLVERLGIADQMKPKTMLEPPGGPALVEAIASKKADLGIDQLTVVDGKAGFEVVGALPKEFGGDIVMAIGIAVSAKQPDAAATLVKFLTSPTAAPMIKKRGMQPG